MLHMCVYIYIYICVYVCMYVCIYIYIYIDIAGQVGSHLELPREDLRAVQVLQRGGLQCGVPR